MKKASMKRPTKKYLKQKCDDLWRDIIKIRANYKCQLTGHKIKTKNKEEGCWGRLESHHFINRWHLRTRHDLRNGICLCANHHRLAENCSTAFMKAVYEYTDMPKHVMDHLESIHRETCDYSLSDYLKLYYELKECKDNLYLDDQFRSIGAIE